MSARRGPTHYHGRVGQAATDVLGEIKLGGATYELRRGHLATVDQATSLAAKYELQREWYERVGGGEPKRVKARRLAFGTEGVDREADAGLTRRDKRLTRPSGPSVAHFIRKGLLEGLGTKEIVATVLLAFPGSRCGAKSVAYYRHHMRAAGELPAVSTPVGKPPEKGDA